jgi:antitoxin component of MazEF toxin-antitoxin module
MIERTQARRVGGSVVITLKKSILEKTGISDGDSLSTKVLTGGIILVTKGENGMLIREKIKLELKVLKKRKKTLQAEMKTVLAEYSHNMPTAHRGIENPSSMEASALTLNWDLRKIELEIAQKQLQMYELTGR